MANFQCRADLMVEAQRSGMANQRRYLFALLAPLLLAACATTHRISAVPADLLMQADTGFGPVRFLVARETDTFVEEARNLLAKERAWKAAFGSSGLLAA